MNGVAFKKIFSVETLLTIILVLIVLGTIGTLAWVVSTPKEESFTEFYLLDSGGKAVNYPSKLRVGQAGQVTLGIVDREHQSVTYLVKITINGTAYKEIGPVTLAQGEKWEQLVSFVADRAGDKQKVEFLLFRQDQNEVYHTLSLWVNVQ